MQILNVKYLKLNEKGQSLFEVVVAVGISAMILIAVASLAAGSVRNSSFSRNNAQATKFAQEEIEWLRGQRDAGWDGFIGNIASGGCFGSFSWGGSCVINTTFTRSASFVCSFLNINLPPPTVVSCGVGGPNINIVDATVIVSWSDAQGSHQVQSTTRFTDWRR
jgi:type II secretory pathway pseudopilin PulG